MVLVRIPASSANLGPGFDCLGMALNLYNYVEIKASDVPLQITLEGMYCANLPVDESNLVYQAARRLWDQVNYQPPGISLRLINNIPPSRGLGSSSAAIIGGLFAANLFAGSPLSKAELLDIATEIEGHPDNVASALYGGANLAISQPTGRCVRHSLGTLSQLKLVVAIPDMTLATSAARELLPQKVALSDAVWNVGRTGLLVAALISGDYSLLQVAMEDRLHEQYRACAIPGMLQALDGAKKAGAIGAVLSGAGPTLLAIVADNCDETSVGQAMADEFTRAGVNSVIHHLRADSQGAVELVANEVKDTLSVNYGGVAC